MRDCARSHCALFAQSGVTCLRFAGVNWHWQHEANSSTDSAGEDEGESQEAIGRCASRNLSLEAAFVASSLAPNQLAQLVSSSLRSDVIRSLRGRLSFNNKLQLSKATKFAIRLAGSISSMRLTRMHAHSRRGQACGALLMPA